MTATCHQAAPATYCDLLPPEIDRLARTLADLDLAAQVPTCPDWTVEDLAVHIGTIHRWAMNMVRVLTPKRISSATMELGMPEDATKLAGWVGAGAEPLVETFRAADHGAPMWVWGSDPHARFWPRRMVFESTVHRADAEFTAGIEPVIDPRVAVDGVDEFLDNLPHAAYFAPCVKELTGTGSRIAFRAGDANVAWTITLGPEGFAWDHTEDGADARIEGESGDLLLLVYGRRTRDDGRFKVSGDEALLDFWVERSSI
ncbi:MAG: maleylpyruvate isomerase family mycothiol-dependent enzyme [Actinomycetota bacterium]